MLLTETERKELRAALEANSEDGDALQMGRDTSFVGSVPKARVTEAEVLDLIASVPTHY